MRVRKFISFAVAAATLSVVAQPAFANNKDRTKRAESASSGCNETCRPAVRSMSESTPMRKNDCTKVRRILM
jgi:hypothetical protein